MKYQLKNIDEAHKAFEYLELLSASESIVEIKKISPKRTLNQNAYYHLLLGIFGLELGYTIEEAKTIHKRHISPDIFVYEKKGQKFLKSSSELDTKEMTRAIDRLKQYASEHGINLPPADNKEELMRWENLIEKNNHFL